MALRDTIPRMGVLAYGASHKTLANETQWYNFVFDMIHADSGYRSSPSLSWDAANSHLVWEGGPAILFLNGCTAWYDNFAGFITSEYDIYESADGTTETTQIGAVQQLISHVVGTAGHNAVQWSKVIVVRPSPTTPYILVKLRSRRDGGTNADYVGGVNIQTSVLFQPAI